MTTQKTLIAIVNARHRKEWRTAIRSTWFHKVPKDRADVFFFVGRGEPLADPEGVVELDCLDDYEHLPSKVQCIAKWAREHGHPHMLKIDDDVLLRPRDFLASGYGLYDFVGRSNRPESPYPVTCGFCYVLSEKSMEIVANAQLPPILILPSPLDDERWVAYNLSLNGIKLKDDRRYFLHQFAYPKPADLSRRPLRAPKRPMVHMGLCGPQPIPNTVAFCVHLACELEDKIAEYHKLDAAFGEK